MTIDQELIKIFHEEARELIGKMRSGLDRLSREARLKDSHFRELFRFAHTLKGSSAAVEYIDLKWLAASITEVFRAARGGEIQLDAKAFTLLSEGVDACEVLLNKKKVTDYKKILNQIKALYEK
jgi:two-component system, chemotaxis family, sensor kinase CheA